MDLTGRYVLLGLIWLVAAMLQGLWMAIGGFTQFITMHIVMVLSGGVVGILFGTVLRAWPKAGSDRWANAQFIIWNVGVLIMTVGAATRAQGHGDAIIAAGSLVVLAATLMMLMIFQRSARA